MARVILPRIALVVVMTTVLMGRELMALSLWRTILRDFRLHKFARVLHGRNMSSLFEDPNTTVYLPTSDAFFKFDTLYYGIKDNDYQKWTDMLVYSSQRGRIKVNDLPVQGKIPSRLKSTLYLYVNTFYVDEGVATTINGARIVEADIECDNGILHIIDAVIYPIAANVTVAEYLYAPLLPNLSFHAIIKASSVVPSLKRQTNSTKRLYTSFSPNDSYLYPMPDYGADILFENNTVLQEVYKAHIIEDEALFIPYTITYIPPKNSLHGAIRFYRRAGSVYMVNGRVHAKVVQTNIPTNNGVMHIIDNLVYYIYHNAIQITDFLPDTKMWHQLVQGLTQDWKDVLSHGQVTMFVPTDEAFGKIPLYYQSELVKKESKIDRTDIEKILFGHVIKDTLLSPSQLENGQQLRTMNGQTLTVVKLDSDVYLESPSRKVRSKVEVEDIGVTNGAIHLVSNILFAEDFMVWDAIGDIPQLSEIHKHIVTNFHELRAILDGGTTSQPITVFLPSNTVVKKATDFINSLLLKKADYLKHVLQGHFIAGRFSSSQIVGSKVHVTFSDEAIQLTHDPRTGIITVSGAHVTSRVVVRDILCSNGVVHVIDDLLHVPTRTVWEEVGTREELRYMKILISTIKDKRYNLDSKVDNYTLLIPHNDAFSHLPWETVDQLLDNVNWTVQVLAAHVIKGEMRPLDEIPRKKGLVAFKNLIYTYEQDEKVYVVNNNMRGQVLQANIPATNGWIHIIDKILTVPYVTVADVLTSRPEFRMFHDLVSDIPEYQAILSSSMRQVTLFLPSTRYIKTLKPLQWERIRLNRDLIRNLFYGHVVPNMRIDEEFLGKYQDEEYCSRTAYNMTFKISRDKGGIFVGVGFDIQPLHVVDQAWGCSDGVVYAIDGFLNYSPFTVLERLKREPGLSQSFEHISQLVNPNDLELFNNPDLPFTFLMPDDHAFDYYTFNERLRLHSLPTDQQKRIFWRHVLNGSVVYYDDFKNGHAPSPTILPRDVTINVHNEVVTVRYHEIYSPIKQWNLISCNGVIHILQQFLYDVDNEDVQSDTNSTPSPRRSSTSGDDLPSGKPGKPKPSVKDNGGGVSSVTSRPLTLFLCICLVRCALWWNTYTRDSRNYIHGIIDTGKGL